MRFDHHPRRFRSVGRVVVAAAFLGSAVAVSPVAAAPVAASAHAPLSAPPPCPAGLGAGGEYHPLSPQRIYDSRAAAPLNQSSPGPKPANPDQPTFDIGVLGLGGVPTRAADVLSVVINITVTEPTAGGWLNAYGAGASAGLASIVNFTPQQNVPNLSIVRPGADGRVTFKLFTAAASGSAHVVVDVFGWFSTSCNAARGARLVPISPGRLLDTRTALSPLAANTPLGTGEAIAVQFRGADLATGERLPASANVVGAVLNVTGVNDLATSMPTFLSVFPDDIGGIAPSTSNVNLARGQIKPNMVIVPVGADGKIRVFNNSGTAHVVIDVAGYLIAGEPATTRAGRVVPLSTPFRVFDTREPQWGAVALGPAQSEDWSFADFVGSVNIAGVAVGNQLAVIGNLTSAGLSRPSPNISVNGYLTVYPSDTARPTASNLNLVEGTPIPNLAIMKYSATTTVRVYNQSGNNHYLYDASAVVLAD